MSRARFGQSLKRQAGLISKGLLPGMVQAVICLFLLAASLGVLLPASAMSSLSAGASNGAAVTGPASGSMPAASSYRLAAIPADQLALVEAEEPADPEHAPTDGLIAALFVSAALVLLSARAAMAVRGVNWPLASGPALSPCELFSRLSARAPPAHRSAARA